MVHVPCTDHDFLMVCEGLATADDRWQMTDDSHCRVPSWAASRWEADGDSINNHINMMLSSVQEVSNPRSQCIQVQEIQEIVTDTLRIVGSICGCMDAATHKLPGEGHTSSMDVKNRITHFNGEPRQLKWPIRRTLIPRYLRWRSNC